MLIKNFYMMITAFEVKRKHKRTNVEIWHRNFPIFVNFLCTGRPLRDKLITGFNYILKYSPFVV